MFLILFLVVRLNFAYFGVSVLVLVFVVCEFGVIGVWVAVRWDFAILGVW